VRKPPHQPRSDGSVDEVGSREEDGEGEGEVAFIGAAVGKERVSGKKGKKGKGGVGAHRIHELKRMTVEERTIQMAMIGAGWIRLTC
jgi:hypothetical protein